MPASSYSRHINPNNPNNNPNMNMGVRNNPNEALSHPDDEQDHHHHHHNHPSHSYHHHNQLHQHQTQLGNNTNYQNNHCSLASKPHAFSGAVLTPDHARNISPATALSLASALSIQGANAAMNRGVLPPTGSGGSREGVADVNLFFGCGVELLSGGVGDGANSSSNSASNNPRPFPNNNNPRTRHILHLLQNYSTNASLLSLSEALEQIGHWRIQYTVWITEAWNVLKWSEPSAALFWEMATMYHTLYVASLSSSGGGSASEARVRVLGLASGAGGDDVSGAAGGGGGSGVMGGTGGGGSVGSSSTGNATPMGGGGEGKYFKSGHAMAPRTPHNHTYIPPILSCGSQSSMGSVKSGMTERGGDTPSESGIGGIPSSVDGVHNQAMHSLHQHLKGGGNASMKPARHSAKELPVWLISMFLLVHCEDQAFLRCTSGEDERRFSNGENSGSPIGGPSSQGGVDGGGDSLDFQTMLLHRTLNPRTRLHAGMHQNNANCASFLLRHLRKFLLLCAVPRNADACRAVAALAAKGSQDADAGGARRSSLSMSLVSISGGKSSCGDLDIQQTEQQHEEEHRNIGLNVQLTLEELDRLNLVMQAPSGGAVEEPPIAIGEHILRCLVAEEMEARDASVLGGGRNVGASSHRWNLLQNGLITVADAERILRQYLEAELTAAQQELEGEDNEASEEVTSKLTKMSLSGGGSSPGADSSRLQPISPSRSRGVSLTESNDADTAKDSSSYLKELSYRKLRSTTVLLEPGKDIYGSSNNNNNNNDTNSIHSLHSQTSSAIQQPSNQNPSHSDPSNECGRLHDLHVADCSDTHFYLLQPFEHATVAACTDCTIVIGAVAGLLHVVDCERTTITSAARRVVVSNSFDVVHYLFTPSPPLLVGDNRGCQFAPYNTYYEGLREDLLATGLAATLRSTSPSGGSGGGNILASPTRGGDGGRTSPPTLPALQCASNKWKFPVELSKLELPQLPNIQPPGSPTPDGSPTSPGADDLSLKSSVDLAMKTPVLLPAAEFEILLVPVESEEARLRRCLLMQSEEETNNDEDNPSRNSPASDMAGEEAGDTTTVYSNTSSLTADRDRSDQPGPIESDYCRNLADLLTLSPFHMPHDYERKAVVKAERVRALQQAMIVDLNDQQRVNLQEELNRGFRDWLVTSGNLRQVLDLVHLEEKVGV